MQVIERREDGLISRVVYPDGDAYQYNRDAIGQVTSVEEVQAGQSTGVPLVSGVVYRDPAKRTLSSWTSNVLMPGNTQ